MSGIRFIQQNIDKEHQYFIGHYDDLGELYKRELAIVRGLFETSKRVQNTLKRQGFISVLDDELQIEFRIEVDKKK